MKTLVYVVSLQVCMLVIFNEMSPSMFLPSFNRVVKNKKQGLEEKDMFKEIRKKMLDTNKQIYFTRIKSHFSFLLIKKSQEKRHFAFKTKVFSIPLLSTEKEKQ